MNPHEPSPDSSKAGAVEFPDGRVETPAMPPPTPEVIEQAVAVRVAEPGFVLDTLAALNAGANPDGRMKRYVW